MPITKSEEFAKPKGLCQMGSLAYHLIEAWRKLKGLENSGGCKTYYSPVQWQARGELYGLKSVLVIVHDGGDLSIYNHRTPPLEDESLTFTLMNAGLYIESCTGWYDAVYLT